MYLYSYSVFIFEPNVFVFLFGFYFWTSYIRISVGFFFKRIYSYLYSYSYLYLYLYSVLIFEPNLFVFGGQNTICSPLFNRVCCHYMMPQCLQILITRWSYLQILPPTCIGSIPHICNFWCTTIFVICKKYKYLENNHSSFLNNIASSHWCSLFLGMLPKVLFLKRLSRWSMFLSSAKRTWTSLHALR